MSLDIEDENKKATIAYDAKGATKRSANEIIQICSATTIKYPIGVFQSNGNLCVQKHSAF